MEKVINLNEEQLRNVISKTIESALIAEGIEEGWLDNLMARGRRAADTIGSNVGGVAAGVKGAFKNGIGSNAYKIGKGDYMAKRNQELGAARLQQQKDAIAEVNKEYNRKLGELNKWAGAERAKIRSAYGVDVYSNMAKNGAQGAEQARQNFRQYYGIGQNQDAAQNNITKNIAAESINRIVNEELKKFIG